MWALRPPQLWYGDSVAAATLWIVVVFVDADVLFDGTLFVAVVRFRLKWKKNGNTLRVETAKAVHNACAPLWSPSSVFCFSDLFNYANKAERKMCPPPPIAYTWIVYTEKSIWNGMHGETCYQYTYLNMRMCKSSSTSINRLILYINDIHPHTHITRLLVYFYIKHSFFRQQEKSVFLYCVVSPSPALL